MRTSDDTLSSLPLWPLAASLARACARRPRAEVNEIKIGKQYGLPYIQFVIMEDQKLIEKHAKLQGLGDIKVEWATLGGPGADQRRHHLGRDRRRRRSACRT